MISKLKTTLRSLSGYASLSGYVTPRVAVHHSMQCLMSDSAKRNHCLPIGLTLLPREAEVRRTNVFGRAQLMNLPLESVRRSSQAV
jgi:hypothetical protein